MSKMPEPGAYAVKAANTGKICSLYAAGEDAEYSGVFLIEKEHVDDLITTTQAEAYADARVAESQQWLPIATAPKDGTAVLVANENGVWIAKYEPVYQSGYRPENPWFSLMLNHDHVRKGRPYAPTHWMPLPAPPLPGPASQT